MNRDSHNLDPSARTISLAASQLLAAPVVAVRSCLRRNCTIHVLTDGQREFVAKEEWLRGPDAALAGYQGYRILASTLASVQGVAAAPPVYGWSAEPPILLMGLIRGDPLMHGMTTTWLRAAGVALGHLHNQGYYHDDYAPANLLCGDDGLLYILDPPLSPVALGSEVQAIGKFLAHMQISLTGAAYPSCARSFLDGYLMSGDVNPLLPDSSVEISNHASQSIQIWVKKHIARGDLITAGRAMRWLLRRRSWVPT